MLFRLSNFDLRQGEVMILFCLAVFFLTGWFLPWWAVPIVAIGVGFILPGHLSRTLKVMVAAGLSAATCAYLLDGSSHGLISQRMSQLFNLPSSICIFGLMAVISVIGALLGYRSGIFLKTLCQKAKQS